MTLRDLITDMIDIFVLITLTVTVGVVIRNAIVMEFSGFPLWLSIATTTAICIETIRLWGYFFKGGRF